MTAPPRMQRDVWLAHFRQRLWTLPRAEKGSPLAVEIERRMVARLADTPDDTPTLKFGHPENLAVSEWREAHRRAALLPPPSDDDESLPDGVLRLTRRSTRSR